jgi:23S rRNA pseudouridine955/2504/2580 synthase
MQSLSITATDHGRRLDSLLANLLPTAPIGYITQLIKKGSALVNKSPAAAGSLLWQGDSVTLKESDRLRELLTKGPSPIDILYQDELLLVLNKAAGIAVHRTAEGEENNLIESAGSTLKALRGGELRLRPVNRLDRITSGAVLLAKSPSAAAAFGRLIRLGSIEKRYLTLVEGRVAQKQGIIDLPLAGKESLTSFRLLGGSHHASLLFVSLHTGRTHQIRQHLSAIGHPIAGDRRYGATVAAETFLHSFDTRFIHPVSLLPLTIVAPLPISFLHRASTVTGQHQEELLLLLRELLTSSSQQEIDR